MSYLEFEGQRLDLGPSESVLECLERNGQRLASSCRSGVCQSCLMQVEHGELPEPAVNPLSPAQRAQGYFLACVCKPAGALGVARIDPARLQVGGQVLAVHPLAEKVVELVVQPDTPATFFAGQFFNLILPDGVQRSYSAADAPRPDTHLSFHIGLMPGGKFSTWAAAAQVGDRLAIQGPLGKCCYVPGSESHRPLLLAGTGTGLAPLNGIARAALADGHPGPIWLFHGALEVSGLYLDGELLRLAGENPLLHYRPGVLRGQPGKRFHVGDIQEHIFAELPKLTGFQVYLCGHPDFVKAMQRKAFLAGAGLRDIFADAFLPSLATPPQKV